MTESNRHTDIDGEFPPSDQMGLGPCDACGHDPSCGFASIWNEKNGERWLCHADDHSCYVGAPLHEAADGQDEKRYRLNPNMPTHIDRPSDEPPCHHGDRCPGHGPDCDADPEWCWPRLDRHVSPHSGNCPQAEIDSQEVRDVGK